MVNLGRKFMDVPKFGSRVMEVLYFIPKGGQSEKKGNEIMRGFTNYLQECILGKKHPNGFCNAWGYPIQHLKRAHPIN